MQQDFEEFYTRTFLKNGPLSCTMGTDGNCLSGLRSRRPCFMSYRFDMTSNKSEQVLTGRKRLRGTFIPVRVKREGSRIVKMLAIKCDDISNDS